MCKKFSLQKIQFVSAQQEKHKLQVNLTFVVNISEVCNTQTGSVIASTICEGGLTKLIFLGCCQLIITKMNFS